uniref:GH18 domain-containing protein n=1 Tax=Oryza punctata TaxID=4537 RepID=A0A0E0MIC0_ORYPU
MDLLPLTLTAALLLLAAPPPATADDPGLAVYWGRHKEEGSLREACDTGRYTTVIITFYNVFGYGRYSLDISGHPLTTVGADIKHCQSKGITVLLAIGGQGGGYSLPTNASAADVADNLWNAYLGGHRVGVLLPATTRCSYPDHRLEKALATGLFARIHVRMFGDEQCTMSPRYSWEKWAAAYPGSKVYIGLVASWEQDSAWMFQKDLYYEMLQFVRSLPNYGGLAIYDRYYDKKANYTGEG